MLQAAVNHLNSGILNIVNNKVYVTGFTREKILHSYLERDLQAWCSKGMYDNEELVFFNIKSDALIIVQENGEEIHRHQFKQVHKGTFTFKDSDNKDRARTFIIRKSVYSDHYHFYLVVEKEDSESSEEKEIQSNLFPTKDELDEFLLKRYKLKITY